MAMKVRRWVVVKTFDGEPKVSDFQLLEEHMSTELQPGEVLLEALYLSVDPYMRIEPVVSSKNSGFAEGAVVVAFVGWRTLTVAVPEQPAFFGPLVRLAPDMGQLPASLALGVVGMTGLTAYFGMERGHPQPSDTVLVSAAAGAVGSVAGQIAKIKGCRVIGSAGSKDKCDWLKQIGFDHVFNYKETTVDDALKQLAPDGIDLYFDNVGGDFTYDVVKGHMKVKGRIVATGAVSTYNSADFLVKDWYLYLVEKQLTVLGNNVTLNQDRWPQATQELADWVKQGKLHYRETVTEGFEQTPTAFIELLRGKNVGKAVVRV